MNAKKLLSAVLVVLVVTSGTAVAAGITMDPTAEQYPKTYYQEDQLTVTTHDRASIYLLGVIAVNPSRAMELVHSA